MVMSCRVMNIVREVSQEVSKVVLGHERDVQYLTLIIIMGGHALIYGPPGVAKTLTSEAIAHVMGLNFRRISFTPDLLPSDIIGAKIIDPKTGDLRTVKGPIFANIVLADEINRGNPKSLSALLEAMQEGKVSIEGDIYELPRPFSVIATLNPLETQGIFPLPIAILDRFTISLRFDYPGKDIEEMLLVKDTLALTPELVSRLRRICSASCIFEAMSDFKRVRVSSDIINYVLEITSKLRSDSRVFFGPSPRAVQHMLRVAKGLALLDGRDYVIPDDIKESSIITLRHRIISKGSSGNILDDLLLGESIVKDILNSVEPPI